MKAIHVKGQALRAMTELLSKLTECHDRPDNNCILYCACVPRNIKNCAIGSLLKKTKKKTPEESSTYTHTDDVLIKVTHLPQIWG